MSAFLSRPRWSRRLIAETALLGTLALHAALLLAVRPRHATPDPAARRRLPAVTSVPPPTAGAETANAFAWAYAADPTLLILADARRGFSRFLADARPVPYTLSPASPASLWEATPPKPPAPTLGPGPTPLPQALGTGWPTRQPEPEETGGPPPLPPALPPKGVIWRFADGAPVPTPPDFALDALRNAFAPAAPTAPSRFELCLPREGSPFRLRLLAGSGNPGLDRLAYAGLGPLILAWEAQPPAGRFTPAGGRREIIEVEWRRWPE
ncbi:MAG: hypothetical protein WC789_08095 [Lentisphaeria bacterium]|jgi:hypothetical protein